MSFGLQNQTIHKTPTGRIDSAYLDGNDGSDIVPQWIGSVADLSHLQIGTAFSVDLVAAGSFIDPGSPASELGFYPVSGIDPRTAGFNFSGTTLQNANVFAAVGAFRLVAVRNGISALSSLIAYAISAPTVGSDTVAPSVPTGISAAPGTTVGTIALAFDAPSDTAPPNAPASGVAHVDVLVDGVLASPPSPLVTPTNALAPPTLTNLGNITSPDAPTASQDDKTWILTAAGIGIAGNTAEQCLLLDYGAFPGTQRFIAKLMPYTSGSAIALMGLMVHETAVSGGKFIAIGLRPSNGTVGLFVESRTSGGGTSTQVASLIKDLNGQNIVGPVYVKIERAANNQTWTVSYSLNEIGWTLITTQTLSMTAAVHYPLFISSQSAGTDVTGSITEVSLNNSAPVSATITASAPVQITLRSVDADNNTSALSAAITGVPKAGTSNTRYKFHPGHYAASDGTLKPGGSLSSGVYAGEFDTGLGNANGIPQDWIIGFRSLVTWSHLDEGPKTFTGSVGGATSGTLSSVPTKGNGVYYVRFSNGQFRDVTVTSTACTWTGALSAGSVTSGDFYWFNVIESMVNRCATNYHLPKYYVMSVVPMSFSGGARGSSTAIVPGYITTNSIYGASPDGTSFGWWGSNVTTGLYSAAVWRPAVANRYALLGDALGHKFNDNLFFEAVQDQEDSAAVSGALPRTSYGVGTNDGSYSDANYLNCLKNIIYPAWRAAFPNTSIVVENTWLNTIQPTQDFETWLMDNGFAVGNADSTGQSYYNTHSILISWGMAAFGGVNQSGSATVYPDRRGQVACMMDVEGPDIGTGSGGKLNNLPLDICIGLNNTYKASHAFWSVVAEGTGGLTWAANVTNVLKNNPLTSVSYPANYP